MTDMSISNTTTSPAPHGPAIPADELRARILRFIDSLKTRADTRPVHIEEVLGLKLGPYSETGQMLFALGVTTEGWEYGVSVRPPADSESAWHTHIRFYPELTPPDALPKICTYDFNAVSVELKALGLEQAPGAFTLAGNKSWGFGKDDVPPHGVSYGARLFVYRLDDGTERGQECIKSIDITYGIFK